MGRHLRATGYANDAEKYNEAQLAGWLVLRVVADQIKSGAALEWIRKALLFRM